MTDSKHVTLHKKILENHKRKLKGVTDPTMKIIVQRDIEETERKIKSIIALENKSDGE
jgi:hypothetical protein